MNTLLYLLGLMFVGLFAAPAEAAQPAPPQPMVGKAVVVGDFSVVPLLDGAHGFPISLFKGADEATLLAMAGKQQVSGSFNVFLIEHGQERFLVDTGNGTLRPERNGQLLLCLQEAKTAPEDISKIFVTHLHGDHIGGLVKDGKSAFPKAQVYVARIEYDYWMSDEAMRQTPEGRREAFSMVRGVLRVLEHDNLLVLFTPGEVVSPDITSVALFGHTPGHTGFMLASKGKQLFFVGDLLHAGSIQFARPDINADFDVDQSMARETRQRTLKQVAQDAMPIAAVHLPFPGVGLVRAEGDGYTFETLK
ncbi:MAG: MBL fold metallo-hydrolase [Desulfobulbus sp.]|nr:MBL fold metallo-hydrolase [Desulfobulbus sp.]